MYRGNNPTAIRSRSWISESLIALMWEKPYNKITVAEIYKRADLSRQTFYNLFETKEDVLRFYLEEHYRPPLHKLKEKRDASATDIIKLFASRLIEDREFLSMLLDNGLENMIRREFTSDVYISDIFIKLPSDDSRMSYVSEMLSSTFVSALICWVRAGEPISVDELGAIVQQFLSGELIIFA